MGRFVHVKAGDRLIRVAILAACVAAGSWAGPPLAVLAANVFARGDSVTIVLSPMPDKYQGGFWVQDLFAASADSTFWCGPIKPNIHSWLTLSVICRDTTDFRIEFGKEAGSDFESLEFKDVAPGFYRVDAHPSSHPGSDPRVIRFIYAGGVVHESRVAFPEP
jgi:hypothetical protein